MFHRSENLFLRPAWPEDRSRLASLAIPAAHDPFAARELRHAFIVTAPGAKSETGSERVIGSAGFARQGGCWRPLLWLAPQWRKGGLWREAEDTLTELSRILAMAIEPSPA